MITAVIDQGNTTIKVALFEANKLQTVLRFEPHQEADIQTALFASKPSYALYAASGEWNENLLNNVKKEIPVFSFDAHLKVPFAVDYDSRATVGTDRLANVAMALAAHGDRPTLVVDMGTCITYDVLSNSHFLGGAISPGLLMRCKAMNAFTARLPEATLNTRVPLTGSSTLTSLQSGAFHGWHSEIQEMTAKFVHEYEDLAVVFTGGDLCHFEAGLKSPIFADPYWTLKGFNQILLFNAQ